MSFLAGPFGACGGAGAEKSREKRSLAAVGTAPLGVLVEAERLGLGGGIDVLRE